MGERRVEVEVALPHPVRVRRRVPVLQLERLRLRVLLDADERLTVDLLRGDVVAVAAARVDGAVLADRRSGPRPQPAAAGRPVADLLRREIVRVEVVRIAAASLRGGRVDHAVDQVEPVRFAVGRHEQRRRFDLVTGRDVELAQPAVPRHGVGDVLPGRRLIEDRRRGQSAGTERCRRRDRPAAAPGTCCRSASTRAACPFSTSIAKMLSDTPATIGDLLRRRRRW